MATARPRILQLYGFIPDLPENILEIAALHGDTDVLTGFSERFRVPDMAKTLTLDNGKLVFDGETIATHEYRGGQHIVTINFSYAVNGDIWFQPVADLVNGLKGFPEYKDVAPEVLLVLESDEDDVEILSGVMRRLDEKTVKGDGYKWRFHKNDADNFPSPLHGHDYERGLKIDALTGRIFDSSTKNHCETLKSKGLNKLHRELKGSADFKDKLEQLLPKLADKT